MDLIGIPYNVHNNDFLVVMRLCGEHAGLIQTSELTLQSDCGENLNDGKPHVWVSARLPLNNRGASRCRLISGQRCIDTFLSANLLTETFAFLSPKPLQ